MGPENGWGGEKTRTVKSVPSEKIPGPAAKEPNAQCSQKETARIVTAAITGSGNRLGIRAGFGNLCQVRTWEEKFPKEFVVWVLQSLEGDRAGRCGWDK
jgi:hypothetical protein